MKSPTTAATHSAQRSVARHFHDGDDTSNQNRSFARLRARSLAGVKGQRSDAARRPTTEGLLAATAHELRLPLGHIKGFVTSLRRTDVEWDAETRREFLVEIDQETDRLATLVDALLAACTPHGGDVSTTQLAFTQPATVVEGALHQLRGLHGQRPLRLEVPSSLPAVCMDAAAMERVLTNLIENALKYSPPGAAIGVSVRLTSHGELAFTIEDEGPGIPAADRERIFEPFVRVQSTGQEGVPGYGLGLAICRSIVLAHDGRIQVSERPGGGARFSVFLPAHLRARHTDDVGI